MRTVEIEGKAWDVVEVSRKLYNGKLHVLSLIVLWLKIAWWYHRNGNPTYVLKPVYTVDTIGLALNKEEA